MIKLNNIGLQYNMRSIKNTSLKRKLLYSLTGHISTKKFWALRNIDLQIEHGTSLGVIGVNGSGKTTLCTILAGLIPPDEGKIEFNCDNPFFLTINTGFNLDMSGRQNIRLALTLRGLSLREAKSREDEIIQFSDIGEFIESPIRIYSSGMRARLAFSIATSIVPDVLIMDEILNVGDDIFLEKCRSRMAEIIDKSKAMVLVSHRPATIRQFCERTIWIDKGKLHMDGPTEEVLEAYDSWCKLYKQQKGS